MRKVILRVADYSLDGIIGEEDTDFFEFCRAVPDDPAHQAWTLRFLERADLHIMGRVTYQGMAQYFPAATGHPYAEVMNRTPKAVFSDTMQTAEWASSSVISGDTAEQIDKLRHEGTGDILAHGGVSFARSLARLDLVDEYCLDVFPYLAGRGKSLFTDEVRSRELELESSTGFGNGVVGLVYRRRR